MKSRWKRALAGGLSVAMLLMTAACQRKPNQTDEAMEDVPMPTTQAERLLSELDQTEPNYYRQLAYFATEDLIRNFWTGSEEEGQIVPTWEGLPQESLPDERGALWEAGEMLFAIYDMWVLTGEARYETMLRAEAQFYRTRFQPEELEEAGALLHTASDDCAWHAMMYLTFYDVTGDMWFVERAVNLLDNAYARWHDDALGGGMWYRDDWDDKSLYEAGIALDWLRLWEITEEERFHTLALESYNWLQEALGRSDGLYFCTINEGGPVGEFSPDRIHEAGSISFLAGNMAMAVMSAKLYRLTGEQVYLDRVYQTCRGLEQYYALEGDVLLNDRDAWTNATFAAFFAAEVLTLPDTERLQELFYGTARSIVENCRTPDGYYGGTWTGPSYGTDSIWSSKGSIPEQIMTSATSVLMVTAAALLEAGVTEYVR